MENYYRYKTPWIYKDEKKHENKDVKNGVNLRMVDRMFESEGMSSDGRTKV